MNKGTFFIGSNPCTLARMLSFNSQCSARRRPATRSLFFALFFAGFNGIAICLLTATQPLSAQEALRSATPPAGEVAALAGDWVFNQSLSDNTDSRVEASLRAAGERINRRLFDRRQDRYRGGPADQELYDRISYDRELHIDLDNDVYYFTYADQWRRDVYTDNRSRSVSLNALQSVEDFSLGHWENGRLLIESHPRDGGYTQETYTLVDSNLRLRVELFIKPRTFREPIEVTRVYDRRQ